MEWVRLSEAAELEGEKIHAMVMRISRGQYTSKSEPNPQGGKPMVYIAAESLSERAREKYKRRQREAMRRELRESESAEECEPWYYGIDSAWYVEHYREEFLQKTAMRCEIEKYLDGKSEHYKETTEYTEKFAREHLDMSGKQFRRYLKRYADGRKWAAAAAEEWGGNWDMYIVFSLCTPPKKGRGGKMSDEMKSDIENLWSREMYHKNMQSVQMLYEDAVRLWRQRGEEYIPSVQSVRRYVAVLCEKNSNIKPLLQYGIEGFRHDVMMKRRRDVGKLKVMELVQGDAHTFDCWVRYVQPNGKETAIRPYLVAFIDTRSRCIVGWGICAQPNAEVIKQVLLHMIYPKKDKDNSIQGVPRAVYIDNGKDFTAETLTGRKRTERFDTDEQTKGFYKSIGIEFDKRALPYTPWTKAQIERFFGTLIQGFTKRFESYTGTLTGSKTAGKVKKDIKGMLARGELYDMDEFSAMFEGYINEIYHVKKHSGLEAQNEEKPVPIWVYQNAERYFKAAPPIEYALSLLGKSAERNVYNIGIELAGQTYIHEELGAYVGEKVLCRWREDDMSFITVFDREGRQICRAYPAEKLNPLAERDDEALEEHIHMQRRQLRRAKEEIKELQTPYAQRGLQLPEIDAGVQKVVSLPTDKQYLRRSAERAKSQQTRKKESNREIMAQNEFIKQQANKAFERLG